MQFKLKSIWSSPAFSERFYRPVGVTILVVVLITFLLSGCLEFLEENGAVLDSGAKQPPTSAQEQPSEDPGEQEAMSESTKPAVEPDSAASPEAGSVGGYLEPEPTLTPEPTSESTQQPIPTLDNEALLAETDGVRSEIESNVVNLRGLEPQEPVVVTFLDREELRQRLQDDMLEDYTEEDSRNDAIVLSAFDFLSKDFDLYTFTLDLLTEEIAGYYDPETDEFVLISDDEQFDVLEKITHAHEYVHALQDQHFNLELLDDDSLDSEASLALTALAEGDATLVQTLYMLEGYLTADELLAAFTESMEIDTAILDSAPPVLARQMLFPYLDGVSFVEALYLRGGFEAIDQAWSNPPKSTEHILHPERYLSGDEPQVVALAPLTDTLGSGWQMIDQDYLGELYLREYLIQQLKDQAVDIAATGWGGDQYAVYWNEAAEEIVLLLRIAWDTAADSQEFADAYQGYPGAVLNAKSRKQPDGGLCWEGGDVICLFSFQEETVITRAPNLDLATLAGSIQMDFMAREEA